MLRSKSATKYAAFTFSIATAVLLSANSALADQCAPGEESSTQNVVSRCTEDPSCVLVGETHMLEWKSPAPAKVIVVCIHGLSLCARAYKPLAKELSNAGIDGFGVNVRGFGPDRGKPERAKLDCIETVGDVRELLTSLRKNQPDYKIFIVGESMGGSLALRVASENPELVDGVVCSAPAWKLLKLRRTALKGIVELIFFPESEPGPTGRAVMHQATSDPQLAQHLLTDPSHRLKLTLGEAMSFLKFISKTDDCAKRLTKPVLIIQGLKDILVSPRGVAKLYRDIPSTNKTLIIDGAAEHLILEEGMYSPIVVNRLIEWMNTAVASSALNSAVESVNDQNLSDKELRRLTTLRRLAEKR